MDLSLFWDFRERGLALPRSAHDDLIIAFCTQIRARWIVELGSGDGNATRKLIAYLATVEADRLAREPGSRPEQMLWSIDKGDTVARRELSGQPNVEFMLGDSVEAAAWFDCKIDVLYCDSDHSRAHVLAELNAWVPACKPKLVLVDDTLDPNAEHGSPLEAVVDFCAANPGWRWFNIPIHTGLCVLIPPEGFR